MTKNIFFYTFGCKVNQYDTQQIRENFLVNNFYEVNFPEEAHIIIINSCSVTAQADRQCRQIARRMLRLNSHADVVICGCYTKRAYGELKKIFKDKPRIKLLKDLNEVLSYYSIPKLKSSITSFSEHSRAYLKIQDGCDQFCSYCIIPYIRGEVHSKPKDDAINEVKKLVENGYLEIVLCGVRLGRYQPQKDYFLEDLILDLLKLEGVFRLRLSSIEITEVSERLLKVMSENKAGICWHLHIPLQSGADEILKSMNRPYNTKFFEDRTNLIRKYLPEVAITTDVIVGFPGETDETFRKTTDFIQKIGFSKVHIFPYSIRPGTAAAGIKFRRDNEYLKKLQRWKEELFRIDSILQKKAKEISMTRPHQAIPISEDCVLTEDYHYYKVKSPPPDTIFSFNPQETTGFSIL